VSQSGTGATSLNLNANNSNGNDGNQGHARGGGNPQGPDPGVDPLSKLRFTHRVGGGPMA